jgi:hypothetical protein
MPFRVLAREEVQEMRMVVSTGPTPALRKFEIEAEVDLVGGVNRTTDA